MSIFNIRNARPTAAFAAIIDQLEDVITNLLYPSLYAKGMTLMTDGLRKLCIAKVSNFQHLQAKYQEYGVPVYALTEAQIGTMGNVLAEHKRKQDFFREIYESFASQIINLT